MFSAAKLFFAYGLGNALTFPMAVGATTVLTAERPTPALVFAAPDRAAADDFLRRADALRGDARRGAISAAPGARAAPLRLGRRGAARRHRPALAASAPASTSSTASAPPRCCTSFCPTAPATCATGPPASRFPATSCASSTSREADVADGETGELCIKGPTAAMTYWNNRANRAPPSWASGRAAATSIGATRPAITSIAAATTTCSR